MIQDADDLISDLDRLVGEVPGKPYPIYLEIFPFEKGKSSQISLEFLKPEGGAPYRLQIYLRLGRGSSFEQKQFERVILQMLVMERSLRSLPEGESVERVEVRPWLLDGLAEAIQWKNGKGDRRMYSSLMESGGWIEVEDLVDRAAIAGLDVLSRELFRASSGALVMALLAQNQGAKSLAEFLGKVAVFEGEQMILLRAHFPQANLGPKGLERWWMLQVAALSEKKLSEAMTIPETDERLSGILELHLKNENEEAFRVSLGSWRQVAGLQSQEERIESIRPANDLLAHLSFRCFPTFRPVIAGYLKILSDVADGKTEEVEEMIRNLEEFRTAEVERHQKLVDLMDWYHLSSVRKESGEFEDYLKMQKNLRKGNEFGKDPLHQYLDKVQKVFEKPK
ncbi:hypothetical protein N9127_02925 [Akkermansiaceae bacterium]|nr:hypothetical protein [Akkermansiaceae bacterium]MDA7912771.1 hypothetical protein [bacterium]MDA7897969.1 hypothetical protein [Akkermansiaceae bacterium]MDA8958909.1 hypothetical protein [Akkermansiaceae bacterium]MDA8979185.1 hypothetical protein [bacterium]